MDSWNGFRSCVSHLECSATGERFEAGRLHNLSSAGKPLLVRYDLEAVARQVDRQDLARREPTLWRYRELLPLPSADSVVSLGEEATPIVPLRETSRRCGGDLLVKDEGRLPTGSFKARGMAVAVSMAKSLGVQSMAVPTVGSGGVSLAAYCRRAGIEAHVFCTADAPPLTMREIAAYDPARFHPVDGPLEACNRLVAAGCAKMGWFNISTLKEPYRIEGKKTMGLELADQLGWTLPDLIFYPTGGGTGFIGMWKAFDELEHLGWIGPERPRMVAVQTTGCCPIVKAAERGEPEISVPWSEIRTRVHGVKVAKALGDFLILRVIYESGGFGVAVDDDDVERTRSEVAEADGMLLSPEGAACVAAYRKALASGQARPGERAIAFNTATGLRAELPAIGPALDPSRPLDVAALQ